MLHLLAQEIFFFLCWRIKLENPLEDPPVWMCIKGSSY